MLVKGVPTDIYDVTISTGDAVQGALNDRGKATITFTDLPSGAGVADALWGCGAFDSKAYACP